MLIFKVHVICSPLFFGPHYTLLSTCTKQKHCKTVLLNVQMVLSTCEAAGKNYIFDKGPTYMK